MCRKDEQKCVKEHDEYGVGTSIQESIKLFGQEPLLSFLVSVFIRAHEDINQVVVEVTGRRKVENGLVIPGTFKTVTRSW